MARIPVETRREMLFEAAFRVIAQHGVDGATTRAIAGEAGMTLSTLHYVFESRDELLAALVERGTDNELAVIADALGGASTGPLTGVDGVRKLLHDSIFGYIQAVVDDPDRAQALVSLNQYTRQKRGLTDLGATMYHRYYQAITAGLVLAAEQCGVDWITPPEELAPLVVAATDGITLSYLNVRDHDICERIGEATVGLLVRHVTAP